MKIKHVLSILLLLSVATALTAQQEDALVAFREGRFRDAIRITSAEIQRTPSNIDSYVVQGWAHLSLGAWADAVDSAQRGLQLSRYDNRLVAIMGEAQYQLGNYIAALQYLQEYTAIRPDGPVIDQMYQMMGEIFFSFGEYHHADIAYSTAVYYNSGNAEWWSRLGIARENAGDASGAREAYNSALRINPNLPSATQGLERVGNSES